MRVWWSNCRIYAKNRRNRHGGSTLYRQSRYVKYIDHYQWCSPTGYIYEFVPTSNKRKRILPPWPVFKGTIKICGKIEFKKDPT